MPHRPGSRKHARSTSPLGRHRSRTALAAVLSACAALLWIVAPGRTHAAVSGLVAAWSFNEGSGTTAGDSSGNGHTGAVSNATWTASGKLGGALTFNGTSSMVTVADAADLDLTTGMTLEAWVRPSTTTGWQNVVMKETSSGLAYALYAVSNTNQPPSVYGRVTGDNGTFGPSVLPVNTWTHLAGTYDGKTFRLYVGGSLVASQDVAGKLVTSTAPLRIGADAPWGEYFNGTIDEVRVYNRALSAAEIAGDMTTPITNDTTAPTVKVTAPAAGAVVHDTVMVAADAADDVGVAGVQFLLDGTALQPEDTAAPYQISWNTGTVANGQHTLAAKARDTSGNVTTSDPVTVDVENAVDTTAPTVSLTAPADGATVSGTVPVTASASDDTGVAGVQFRLDGTALGSEVTTAPYTISWDTTTTTTGTHELTAVARDGAGNTATSAKVSVTVQAVSDPRATTGQWSGPYDLPNIMQHAILLPGSNKVLYFEDGAGARVLDVGSGAVTAVPVASNLFCAGHAILADGRPLLIGGDTEGNPAAGIVDTNVFDPATLTWKRLADMHYKRWYPTATVLSDGRVLAVSGSNNGCLTCFVSTPEVYDPTKDTWTTLPTASQSIPYYPFMYVLPDGRLVQVGATEDATTTQVLDPKTWTWSTLDSTVIDAGSSTMYRPGHILKAGTASDGNTPVRPSSPNAYVLDMTASSPSWHQTDSMAYPRAFLNLTTLADGTVLATGGETTADGTNVNNAVKAAEQWSPATGTWTTLASMQVPRLYHSMALLLPDGRVLVGGSGNDGAVPSEPNYEIFSPPYLFKGARPTISSAPGTIPYGGTFAVATPDPSSIASVALVRPAAVTHGFDENARYVPLSFTANGSGLTVTAPADGNLAPPGNYMLFIVDKNGVPSVASWTRLPAPYEDSVAPGAPSGLSASVSGGDVSLSWTAATDNIGVTGYTVYRSQTQGFTPSPATQVGTSKTTSYVDQGVAAGTYYYRVTAQDAAGNSGPASNEASATVAASGDTTPPTVSLTAPAAGATVTGTVDVTASASDDVGVTGVQFLLDGQALGTKDTTAPYSVPWDTTTASNGTHQLSAKAEDAAGNTATSAAVSVTVSNASVAAPSVDVTVGVNATRSTATTPAFSTTGSNELLLAYVTSDGPSGSAQSATVTGAGLTWTLVKRSNTQPGASEVWQAVAPGPLSGVTVQSVQARTGYDQMLTVVGYLDAGGVGSSAAASARSGAPTVSLTASAGSLVFGAGNDWDSATGRKPAAGQTLVRQWLDTRLGDTFWVQRVTDPTTSAGTATISDTAPTSDRWNLVAVEVKHR